MIQFKYIETINGKKATWDDVKKFLHDYELGRVKIKSYDGHNIITE